MSQTILTKSGYDQTIKVGNMLEKFRIMSHFWVTTVQSIIKKTVLTSFTKVSIEPFLILEDHISSKCD